MASTGMLDVDAQFTACVARAVSQTVMPSGGCDHAGWRMWCIDTLLARLASELSDARHSVECHNRQTCQEIIENQSDLLSSLSESSLGFGLAVARLTDRIGRVDGPAKERMCVVPHRVVP